MLRILIILCIPLIFCNCSDEITVINTDIEFSKNIIITKDSVREIPDEMVIGLWKVNHIKLESRQGEAYSIGESSPYDYWIQFNQSSTIDQVQGYYQMSIVFYNADGSVAIGDCFQCYLFEDSSWDLKQDTLLVNRNDYIRKYFIHTISDEELILMDLIYGTGSDFTMDSIAFVKQ